MKAYFLPLIFALLALTLSCRQQPAPADPTAGWIEEGRRLFAPDPRTSVFRIETLQQGAVWVLRGECDAPEAKAWLLARFDSAGLAYADSLAVLPDPVLGDRHLALVRLSVANLRARPSHAAEMVTQALLGTALAVLRQQGGWSYVQMPDRYLGWVETEALRLFTTAQMDSLQGLDKVMFLPAHGYAVDDEGNPVSDLVAGNLLVYLGERACAAGSAIPTAALDG
jgi:gamma-D-glutamyl-L-lysine dipeptidyl-peptidase